MDNSNRTVKFICEQSAGYRLVLKPERVQSVDGRVVVSPGITVNFTPIPTVPKQHDDGTFVGRPIGFYQTDNPEVIALMRADTKRYGSAYKELPSDEQARADELAMIAREEARLAALKAQLGAADGSSQAGSTETAEAEAEAAPKPVRQAKPAKTKPQTDEPTPADPGQL